MPVDLEQLWRRVFPLGQKTKFLKDDSYIASYPHLIAYFDREETTEADVVRGAHMAYGWMPTILGIYPSLTFDLASGANLLNKARNDGILCREEIEALSRLINNSTVGSSKLLHFAAPKSFAIWDSRVYLFIHQQPPHPYRVNNVDRYVEYLTILKNLAGRAEFPEFHRDVEGNVGYPISPMRSLELIMFRNAPA
jgi:hypothetical protein